MKILLEMLKAEGKLKQKQLVDKSPLGYRNTLDAKARLTAGLLMLRDSNNMLTLTKDSDYKQEFARYEIIRRIFSRYGFFSAEHLSMYTKGEYRMFEIRSILSKLEKQGYLVKGYLLEGSDVLHWFLKEDLNMLDAPNAHYDAVISPRDNLMHYLVPFVQRKFGMGSSSMIISKSQIIAAAVIKSTKNEHILVKYRGQDEGMSILRDFSSGLGKRLITEKEEIVDEYDDVVDWYEKYTRPGGK